MNVKNKWIRKDERNKKILKELTEKRKGENEERKRGEMNERVDESE